MLSKFLREFAEKDMSLWENLEEFWEMLSEKKSSTLILEGSEESFLKDGKSSILE